jgi:organic radical activating enzyme
MTSTASISEIFSSIQGEGVYVGERQVFVRFIGCNIECDYCDTIQNLKPDECILKDLHETKKILNPVSLDEAAGFISKLNANPGLHHSLCLTGGEPLLQVDFLKELLPKVKMKKYLETNGTLPDHLAEIIDLVDIIAMDIKLTSAANCTSYMKEHAKFLEAAYMKEVFVKVVFTKDSTPKEIDEACDLVAAVDASVPMVLQPVTPQRGLKNKPTPEQCLSFQAIAKRKLKKVLVIPQTHKLTGLD